jgi:amino acid transporter
MDRDKSTVTSKGKMSTEAPVPVPAEAQAAYDVDYEKYGAQREANPLPELKRKLKSRHLQMIAIGESDILAMALNLFLFFSGVDEFSQVAL